MADVALKSIAKSFGSTRVIHDLNCTIGDGEFVVIVGPSGCGKSTLLRMIAGLEAVSQGQVSIGGRIVNDLEPADRDIAMVFQNYALYPHMTVFGNMAYGLKIRGMSQSEIDERVRHAAEILELGELLQRKPRQLSGGQRQRVAMGRAIVREPAVFLFDEPLSNLDAKLRVQMRVEIKQLQRELGITSIYVTHDQVEAMTLGNRLIVMNEGRAEQIGSPIEVYEHPATIFVAGFIGSPSMNFFDAVLRDGGRAVELASGDRLALAAPLAGNADGTAVRVGIRPEHLTLDGVEETVVGLQVDLVEQLGADTLVHGHFGAGRATITARLPGIHYLDTGATIGFEVAPGQLHVFDRDSGSRL